MNNNNLSNFINIASDSKSNDNAIQELISSSEDSLKMMNLLLDTIQTGIVIIETSTKRIVYSNPAALEMFGMNSSEVLDNICNKVMCPAEDGKCPIIDLGEKLNNSERKLVNSSGENIPILKTVTSMMIGSREYLMESFMDLTGIREVEKKTIEQTAFLKNVIDSLQNPFFIIDIETHDIKTTNLDEGHKQKCYSLIAERTSICESCPIPQVKETGEELSFEMTCDLGRGTREYLVNCTPVHNPSGTVTEIIENFVDITEIMAANAELEENEKKYRSIFESYVDLYFQTDMDGTITDISPSCLKLSGYKDSALRGMNISEFYPDKKGSTIFFKELLRYGSLYDFEAKLKHNSGMLIPVSINCHILYENNNRPYAISGTIRDITEQKKLEETMRKATVAEIEANRAKSEFLATMSHEIRTPMNAIIGMTELTLDTALNDEQKEYLSIVRSNSDSLLNLIDEILDFSKIEAGQMEVEKTDFDIRQLIENIVESLSLKTKEKNIELICYIDPETPYSLKGDSSKLRQVMINLLGNAIKFTEEGEISVMVDFVGKRERGTELKFSVTDTGIGISSDKQKKIFTAFSQEDSSTTRKYGGTGLGLSISRSLVELMGSSLQVESEKGKGCNFFFNLEFEQGDPILHQEMYDYPDFKTLTALLVDDNKTNRLVMNKTLKNWGFTVYEARCGKEAVSFTDKLGKEIDVVILDQIMPEMDGLETARQIRRNSELDGTKIILISSLGVLSEKEKQRLNITEAMKKPVMQSRLHDALMTALRSPVPVEEVKEAPEEILPVVDGTVKLLLVEDNIDNTALATRILEKNGYEVDTAVNGKIATEMAAKHQYNCILMDIEMPVMDGFDATRTIREGEVMNDRKRTPIVALTAHALEGYREKCFEAGMDDFVTKPIKKDILLKSIKKFTSPLQTVLIVDDSKCNRLIIEKHIENTGLELNILQAENGSEALRYAEKEDISIILMDIEMPVMEGMEAVKKIRLLPDFASTPVIAMTAHSDTTHSNECLNSGFSDFLVKPLKKADIKNLLSEHLELKEVKEDMADPGNNGKEVVEIDSDMADLIPGYMENRISDVQNITEALPDNDFDKVRLLGHSMKGSGGMYGFQRISDIGASLETAAKNNDRETIKEKCTELAEYLKIVEIVNV